LPPRSRGALWWAPRRRSSLMDLSKVRDMLSAVPVRFEDPRWLLTLVTLVIAVLVSAKSVAGMARWRRTIALSLRVLILAGLCLALAGTKLLKSQDSLCVIFLVDGSKSISEDQRDLAVEYVKDATQNMHRGKDKLGVVVFGEDASLETAPSESPQVDKLETITKRDNTDIAQAARLGLASFPEGSAKRMVLLCDGNETLGRATEEARVAAANEVPIDIVRLHTPYENEVALDQVVMPPRVKIGEPFDLKVVVNAIAGGQGKLMVYRNKQLYGEQDVKWVRGKSVFRLRQSLEEAGFWTYQVVLVTDDDSLVENNTAMGFTHVEGAPRVLFCSGDLANDKYIPNDLADGHMKVETAGPAGIPTDLSDIATYDAVIFSDIPATAMRKQQMELIRSACRDLGTGFMMLGGENSFGMGGYFKTPVEETLPVSMDITHKKHFPATSLVIAVDTSGSMAMIEGGKQKIEIANEAACLAAELLTQRDQLCVLSVDTMAAEVLPLSNVEDVERIKQQIRTMRPGGGGIFCRTALVKGYDVLRSQQCTGQIRHMILAADGADAEQLEGCEKLARDMLEQEKITTTVISLEEAQFTPELKRVAEAGGGRLYVAQKMEDVPRIYTRETMIVARSPVIEEPFYPIVDSSAQALRGIDWSTSPPLLGYVGTTEKETAQVSMRTHKDDPLLASWQFGVGTSVAFTSDGKSRWGAEWVGWSGSPKFWQQVVRSMLRAADRGNFESTVDIERGEGTITVEALGDSDEFLNYLEIRARLLTPDNEGHDLKLEQIAPGRYQQRFDAKAVGPYMVNLSYTLPDGTKSSQNTGAVIPYPEEYRKLDPDDFMLSRIADITGGRRLDFKQVSDVYGKERRVARTPVPIWPALTLFSVLAFVADVATRRLAFDRRQLEAAREKLVEFRARIRREGQPEVEVDPTLGRLLVHKRTERWPARGIREPARSTETQTPVTTAASAPHAISDEERTALRGQLEVALSKKGQQLLKPGAPPPPPAAEAPPAEGDTFSRLLAAKKKVAR